VKAGVVAATRRLLAIALTRQEFEQGLTVNGKVGLKAPLGVRRRVQRGAGGSCRCEAARLATPSQPDRHHLSCLVAKMILVTYKSDAHPPDSSEPVRWTGYRRWHKQS